MKPIHYSNGPGYVRERKVEYYFYLMIHELFDGSQTTREFINLIENFGKKLDDRASLTLPQTGDYAEVRRSVLRLPWSEGTRQYLESYQHPVLLLARSELAVGDFEEKTVRLFFFTDGTTDPGSYFEVLNDLAKEVNGCGNLFALNPYLGSVPAGATGFFRNLWDAIQLKPGMFGIGIDLKKLIKGKNKDS
jgi:hypothetical protein